MRWPNLANVLVVLGLGAVVGSMFVPTISARRVARIEDRALEAAGALRRIAIANEPVDLTDPAARQVMGEALRAACVELGQPDSDLPVALDGEGDPVFTSRHFLIAVTREPPPRRPPPDYDPAARRSLEVYAWPRTLRHPGRTTFFLPESGADAYTRNMRAGYHELRRRPRPGAGRARTESITDHGETYYHSEDEERWIMIPPDVVPSRSQ